MQRLFEKPILAINSVNVGVLAAGLYVATRLGDPVAAQRTGSAIAAITGLFVIWQVAEEVLAERQLRRSIEPASDITNEPALARVANSLERARQTRRDSAIREARLILVISIALWLSVGESLHGFGDIVFAWMHPR